MNIQTRERDTRQSRERLDDSELGDWSDVNAGPHFRNTFSRAYP